MLLHLQVTLRGRKCHLLSIQLWALSLRILSCNWGKLTTIAQLRGSKGGCMCENFWLRAQHTRENLIPYMHMASSSWHHATALNPKLQG